MYTAPRYWSRAYALLAALPLAIKSARPDRQQLRPDQRPVTVAVEPVEDRVDLGSQFGKRDAVVVIHVGLERNRQRVGTAQEALRPAGLGDIHEPARAWALGAGAATGEARARLLAGPPSPAVRAARPQDPPTRPTP